MQPAKFLSGHTPAVRTLEARIGAVLEQAVTSGRIVGAVVCVAQDGNLAYAGCKGYADREAQRPMRLDTEFRLSSLSKPIVSATALALVERGSIKLQDDVCAWLPEFRPRLDDGSVPEIAIRHLLTHTAGLSYRFLQPLGSRYEQEKVSDGLDGVGLALAEALKRISAAGLLAQPGSCWGYSLGADVLGAVLERAADESLPNIVSKLITGPLSLSTTSFSVLDTGRLAIPYTNASPPARMRDGDIVRFGDGAGIVFCPTRILDPQFYPSAGVGMIGNALEFLQFLEAVRQGGYPILDKDSASALMTNQIGNLRVDLEATSAWGFGYGGAVLVDATLADGPQKLGTWKWGGVYGHHWYVDPGARTTVVALTNTAIDGMVGRFPQALLRYCRAWDEERAPGAVRTIGPSVCRGPWPSK